MENIIPLGLKHFQHLGIPVNDMSVSVSFYHSLGFKNVMQAPFFIEGFEGLCVMMQLNDMIIELYQMPAPHLESIKSRKAGRIDHIAFDVEDIDATFNTAKEAQLQINEEAPVFLQFWEKGCKYFTIQGPDGETLEFNQIIRS